MTALSRSKTRLEEVDLAEGAILEYNGEDPKHSQRINKRVPQFCPPLITSSSMELVHTLLVSASCVLIVEF